jgi:hypothetical protein
VLPDRHGPQLLDAQRLTGTNGPCLSTDKARCARGKPRRNTFTPRIFTWSSNFDGLARIDEAGEPRSCRAASWEVVEGN